MGERCGVSLKGLLASDMMPSRHMRRNDRQPCAPVTFTKRRQSDEQVHALHRHQRCRTS